MNTILIKGVLHEGSRHDILIEGRRFKTIAPEGSGLQAAEVIDGKSMAILPGFYNTHTHAAMTLCRGYADDMALGKWLSEYIWPFEDKLTPAIRQAERSGIEILFETKGYLAHTQNAVDLIKYFSSTCLGVAWNIRASFFDGTA